MARFLHLPSPDEEVEEDPLAGIANLFDVSIVFIVGLMITLFSVYRMGDLMDANERGDDGEDQRAGRARDHRQEGHADHRLQGERQDRQPATASGSARPIGWPTARSSMCRRGLMPPLRSAAARLGDAGHGAACLVRRAAGRWPSALTRAGASRRRQADPHRLSSTPTATCPARSRPSRRCCRSGPTCAAASRSRFLTESIFDDVQAGGDAQRPTCWCSTS